MDCESCKELTHMGVGHLTVHVQFPSQAEGRDGLVNGVLQDCEDLLGAGAHCPTRAGMSNTDY